MERGKVLIVDDVHTSLCDGLEALGYSVEYLPQIKREVIVQEIEDAVGLVVRSKIAIDETLLECCPELRFIGRAGAGLDQLDMEAISSRRIEVMNAPEGNRDALGEHLMGMLLSLLHKLNHGNQDVKQGRWDREGHRGVELGTRTVGIIGYGMMGSAFAEKLSGFGCKVLAYDRYKSGFESGNVAEVQLEDIFEHADIVSMHVPLTDETESWVDRQFLGQFAKPIYFLNTSRGKVAVLKDLVEALDQGHVLGACLDVLENEKFPTYTSDEKSTFGRLAEMDQVLLSPHVAGWSVESYRRISEVLLGKIGILSQE